MPASAAGRGESSGTSVALGSPIDDGVGERSRQHRHLVPEGCSARICSRFGTARGYKPRDRLATIRNRNLTTLSNLLDQCSKVLPRFTYARPLHTLIVLHVAL